MEMLNGMLTKMEICTKKAIVQQRKQLAVIGVIQTKVMNIGKKMMVDYFMVLDV